MQKFLENKRAVAATVLAVGAVGVAGYLLYTTTNPSNAESTNSSEKSHGDATDGSKPESDASGNAADTKTKKKKPKKKSAASKKTGIMSHGFPTARESEDAPLYPLIDAAKLAEMSKSDKKEIANELKAAGNYAFKNKQFDKALELYSNAILADDADPIFYSNRAAVHGSLKQYEEVVKDATKALELAPDYVKCYNRRGVAYEQLKDFENASIDLLSACTLSGFEDEAQTANLDNTIRMWAIETDAKMPPPKQELPSGNFMKAYLTSYHLPEMPASVKESTKEGSEAHFELKQGLEELQKETRDAYGAAFEHIKKACDLGFKQDVEAGSIAFAYKGVFEYLMNDVEKAMASVDTSLLMKPSVFAYLLRAVMHIDVNDIDAAKTDFDTARNLDPANVDLHYQLGQFEFAQSEWQNAIKEYEECIKLDSDFILPQIQLLVCEYRLGMADKAQKGFAELEKKYPDSSNAYNFNGEILLDSGDAKAAVEHFDKAIALEKEKSEPNPLPMINKSIAYVNLARNPADIENAREICKEAEKLDPRSAIVITTSAQFALQQGDFEEAVRLFKRAAELSRADIERVQALTFALTAQIQLRIASERPAIQERVDLLRQLAAAQ